jgi:hypothetical protein
MDEKTPIYTLYEILETVCINDENIKAVTKGDITRIDLAHHSIFELAHIQINDIDITTDLTVNRVMYSNITIFLMDKLYIAKDSKNNEIDILNTLFVAGNNIINNLLNNYDVQINPNSVSFEPFTERFENVLVGYAITFNIVSLYDNLC